MSSIMTIGYEGSSLEDFLKTLVAAEVDVLVDIREYPVSRKPGFSKNSLKEAVNNLGLEYHHFKSLGDPKPGREAARRGDMTTFRRVFKKHLSGEQAQIALSEVAKIASGTIACLLCFEKDHSSCHRSIVADAIADTLDARIRNLVVASN